MMDMIYISVSVYTSRGFHLSTVPPKLMYWSHF